MLAYLVSEMNLPLIVTCDDETSPTIKEAATYCVWDGGIRRIIGVDEFHDTYTITRNINAALGRYIVEKK